MPRTATITLADTEYQVAELKTRKNARWLQGLEGSVREVIEKVLQAADMEMDEEGGKKLLAELGSLLSGSMDTLLDALIEFAPDLKDEIEDSYTSELIPAFVEVVKLAVPFEQIQQMLSQETLDRLIEIGSRTKRTGTN